MVRVHLFPPSLTRVLRSCFSFPLQTHTHTKLLVCVFAVRQIIWVPCQKNFCFSQCTNILPLSITSNSIWCILRWGSMVRVHLFPPSLTRVLRSCFFHRHQKAVKIRTFKTKKHQLCWRFSPSLWCSFYGMFYWGLCYLLR